jgi:AcrR family transcriptional regulator
VLSKSDWLAAGLEILAAEGAPAITIDRLCRRLGVSKGSFHHHFAGIGGFRRALLATYEEHVTAAFDRAIARYAGQPPQATLIGLTAAITEPDSGYDPSFEVAMRAWAFSDPEAHAVQQRIDQSRVAALESVWSKISPDAGRVRISALLPYLVAVGASMLLPPVEPAELRQVYELLQELLPPVAEQGLTEPPQHWYVQD